MYQFFHAWRLPAQSSKDPLFSLNCLTTPLSLVLRGLNMVQNFNQICIPTPLTIVLRGKSMSKAHGLSPTRGVQNEVQNEVQNSDHSIKR